MRISLIFPFVCALVLLVGVEGSLVLALGLLVLGGVAGKLGLLTPVSETICYTGMFVIGISLARWLPEMLELLGKLNRKWYWALFLCSVLLYAYSPSVFYRIQWSSPAWDGFTAIGAGGIILFSLADPHIGAVLHHRFVKFLGKISYSVYLLHLPILLTFGFVFYKKYPPIFWVGPYLITTFVLASVMYYVVELPSIKAGRELARRLSTPAVSRVSDILAS